MRAIKRVRYGEKELKRLTEMVSKTEQKESSKTDTVMAAVEEIVSKKIDKTSGESMETDQALLDRNKKTLQNEHGQYPEWMNGRRLKKQKVAVKRLKRKGRK